MSVPLMTDETIGQTYECRLAEATGGQFSSLRQVSTQDTTDQSVDKVVNIYAIIHSVHTLDELSKKVVVIDPTNPFGLAFIVININTNIVVKNILRLTNISRVDTSDGPVFSVKTSTNLCQFYSFIYDYNCDNDSNYGNIFPQNNKSLHFDKTVAKLLEEWFANTFLQCYSFDKLSIPSVSSGAETYTDFACIVIASQLLGQSIQLTVYDGTEPAVNVHNHYLKDYCRQPNTVSNQFHRLNTDVVFGNGVDVRRFVFVNVWRNQSNHLSDHYNTALHTTLVNGDDLLILFNVQLSKASDGQSLKLNLRSGRHYGKGIRKVHRNSVFGRYLLAKIKDRELAVNPCVGRAPDIQSIDRLIALGCRRLQALYSQQMVEKDFPLCYRNCYEFDSKTIENVLHKCRQLSRFPYNSYTKSVSQMQTIASFESLGKGTALIRASIVDHIPKCVFPTNQFILLECLSCKWTETYRKHRNSVYANIFSDCQQLIQCPKCRQSQKESKLSYFYAIVFTIQDMNCDKTRVCITRVNATNVFGVEAQEVLEDTGAAMRLDNVLTELMRESNDQNGVDWIVRKGNTYSEKGVYEVLSVGPKNSF